ncbi:MAG: hypothetical protein JW945_03575 [Methanomicrobia archaeon]|nr:hypothetical protein [Methanomicrobia archaeon]
MEKEEETREVNVQKVKEEGRFTPEEISKYFRFGVFVILILLLLVATFHFYIFALDAISTLFTYQYRSLVQAGFAACVIVVVFFLLRVVLIKER